MLSKALGLSWTGNLGDLSADDVLTEQVRTTYHPSGRLLTHEDDADDRRYWLVRATRLSSLDFEVEGWMLGRDTKQKQWWSDPQRKGRWAYFVPTRALHTDVPI